MTRSPDRPSVYVVIGSRRDLNHDGGDVLNEIKMYRRLSSLFSVHYNGQEILWDQPDFGIEPRPLTIPSSHFSLYYIRNNPELAASVRGRLLLMAYPYEPELWKHAAGLVVTTEAWRRMLVNFNTSAVPPEVRRPWYPSQIVDPPPIFLAEQSISPGFGPKTDDFITRIYRARFGLGFRIGFIGRLDPTCYPHDAVEAVSRLKREFTKVSLTFIGRHREVAIPDWIQVWPKVPHVEMPYVTSAFDCLLYDQDATGEWLGSAKVLEAMACGVPILVRPHAARIEQLGPEYPLFYRDSHEILDLLTRLVESQAFRQHTTEYLLQRAREYDPEAVSQRFAREFQSLAADPP